MPGLSDHGCDSLRIVLYCKRFKHPFAYLQDLNSFYSLLFDNFYTLLAGEDFGSDEQRLDWSVLKDSLDHNPKPFCVKQAAFLAFFAVAQFSDLLDPGIGGACD